MNNQNLGTFIKGLEILSKYLDAGMEEFDFFQAEHDQIYFFVYEVDEEDAKLLEEYGFFEDENDGWSYS